MTPINAYCDTPHQTIEQLCVTANARVLAGERPDVVMQDIVDGYHLGWQSANHQRIERTVSDARRFYLRLALEAAGSSCESYEGGFTLAIMRGKFCSVDDAAKRLGLSLVPNGLRYFPLGTAQVAEEFRHWCPPYTAERGHAPGFWLFATYRPAD